MPTTNVLVKYSNNYKDEFDLEGFVVMPASEWEAHKAMVAKIFEGKVDQIDPCGDYDSRGNHEGREETVYFGTNEEISYGSLEDYLSSFTVVKLNDNDLQVLSKLFGPNYIHGFNGPRVSNGMLAFINTEGT